MGGSFDPVHNGHLSLAEDAFAMADLSGVIFIPAKISPFKIGEEAAPQEDRTAMLTAAAEELGPEFSVSDLEMKMEGVSYTYRTLRALKQRLEERDRLFFITGTDTYITVEKWRNGAEVLENTSFIVGKRPGYEDDRLDRAVSDNRKRFGTETIIIQNRELDISSTEIRRKAGEGRSLAGLVPESVERYINEHGLYRKTEEKNRKMDQRES